MMGQQGNEKSGLSHQVYMLSKSGSFQFFLFDRKLINLAMSKLKKIFNRPWRTEPTYLANYGDDYLWLGVNQDRIQLVFREIYFSRAYDVTIRIKNDLIDTLHVVQRFPQIKKINSLFYFYFRNLIYGFTSPQKSSIKRY